MPYLGPRVHCASCGAFRSPKDPRYCHRCRFLNGADKTKRGKVPPVMQISIQSITEKLVPPGDV